MAGCKGNVFRDSSVVFLDKKEIFFYVNREKLIREKCLRYYKTLIHPGYAM